jgi:hypothetical protein
MIDIHTSGGEAHSNANKECWMRHQQMYSMEYMRHHRHPSLLAALITAFG